MGIEWIILFEAISLAEHQCFPVSRCASLPVWGESFRFPDLSLDLFCLFSLSLQEDMKPLYLTDMEKRVSPEVMLITLCLTQNIKGFAAYYSTVI